MAVQFFLLCFMSPKFTERPSERTLGNSGRTVLSSLFYTRQLWPYSSFFFVLCRLSSQNDQARKLSATLGVQFFLLCFMSPKFTERPSERTLARQLWPCSSFFFVLCLLSSQKDQARKLSATLAVQFFLLCLMSPRFTEGSPPETLALWSPSPRCFG